MTLPQAVVVLVINPMGHILSVSRKTDKSVWGLPGGKVEIGETLEEAAIRELREETGLIGDRKTVVKLHEGKCIAHTKDGLDFHVTAFTMQTSGDPWTDESHDIRWMDDLNGLTEGPFGDYNRDLLQKVTPCHNCLGGGVSPMNHDDQCHVCNGNTFVCKHTALLVDDWKDPDHLHGDLSHPDSLYSWTVARTNATAIQLAESMPRFDVWALDYSMGLFGETTHEFMDGVKDSFDKWPAKIVIVSQSPDAAEFAMVVRKWAPPSVEVTLRKRVVHIHDASTSDQTVKVVPEDSNVCVPQVNLLAVNTTHVVIPPRPSVWHDGQRRYKLQPRKKK